MIKRMDRKYDSYTEGVDDVRDEIVRRLFKYEKENFEDTESYHGFVEGVDAVIDWIDDFKDKRWQEYSAAEPGSPFGPEIPYIYD